MCWTSRQCQTAARGEVNSKAAGGRVDGLSERERQTAHDLADTQIRRRMLADRGKLSALGWHACVTPLFPAACRPRARLRVDHRGDQGAFVKRHPAGQQQREHKQDRRHLVSAWASKLRWAWLVLLTMLLLVRQVAILPSQSTSGTRRRRAFDIRRQRPDSLAGRKIG